jgi:hypothetical protein
VRHVLHPFEEPSAEALERAGRAAALPFERISEAVENAAATASSPGPCYDKCKRRIVRPGRDGAIGLQFSVYPNAPVRANGSFAFTAKGVGDITPHTSRCAGRSMATTLSAA